MTASRNSAHSLDDAADLVVSYGGSLSGEHGDGQARAAMLPKMYGGELVQAFREFKTIWDPDWKMNPGKVVDPNPPDRRVAPRAKLQSARARRPISSTRMITAALRARRCVAWAWEYAGARSGGTMCPSYMVTHEEKDATRGRAHLLFEMLRGEVIGKNGWRDESGERCARSLSRLQRLQRRLPGQRGHGDLQSRVPGALLEGPIATDSRLRLRIDPHRCAAGVMDAAGGEFFHASADLQRRHQARHRGRAATPDAAVRGSHFQGLVP